MAYCKCPTCGVTSKLLDSALRQRGVSTEDRRRVTIQDGPLDGSFPAIATVRVDDCEVFRIYNRPDECLAPDVIDDVNAALERGANL